MKVAVMGAGAVGCYYGGMLARAGHDVVLIGRPQHVDAIRRDGLHLELQGFDGYVRVEASSEPAAASPRREFLINPNRLNVALTRAQRKLILVGSTSALQHLPIFDRLITYCNSMKTVIALSSLPNK